MLEPAWSNARCAASRLKYYTVIPGELRYAKIAWRLIYRPEMSLTLRSVGMHNIRRNQKFLEIIPENDYWNQIRDHELAKMVGDILYRHYPNYHWWIYADTKTAVILIKCGEINVSLSGGLLPNMVIDYNKSQDDSTLMKKVVRAGGELLERANLKRGAFNGEYPKRIDGVPEKQQPTDLTLNVPNLRLIQ